MNRNKYHHRNHNRNRIRYRHNRRKYPAYPIVALGAAIAVILLALFIFNFKSVTRMVQNMVQALSGESADTAAPKVTIGKRIVFTNSIESMDIKGIIAKVKDKSKYDASFVSYEKESDLEVITDEKLEELNKNIKKANKKTVSTGKETVSTGNSAPIRTDYSQGSRNVKISNLKASKSASAPADEGIYRAVIEVKDEHGNACQEAIYIILDKTAPTVDGTGDLTMETDDVTKEPGIDMASYQVNDNADGQISGDSLQCRLELADNEKHVYVNHISVTDRAGNMVTADHQITLVQKTGAPAAAKPAGSPAVNRKMRTLAHEISGFPLVLQRPQLPTGCEITSLTMVLNYYGFGVSKETMARDYLPKVKTGYNGKVDMEDYFCGDPFTEQGIICGASALVNAADHYLTDNGSSYRGVNINGTPASGLYEYINNGIPVVVMVTVGMANRSAVKGWSLPSGKFVDWSRNDHGAVLIGWDDDVVKIACPLNGIQIYSRAQFEKVYASRGYRAMILKNTAPVVPDPTPPIEPDPDPNPPVNPDPNPPVDPVQPGTDPAGPGTDPENPGTDPAKPEPDPSVTQYSSLSGGKQISLPPSFRIRLRK